MAAQGSSTNSGSSTNPVTNTVIIGLMALAGAGLVYFGIIRPIMCKVGLVTCKEEKEKDNLIQQNFDNKAFNPEYWKTKNPTLGWDRARALAEKAYNAAGIFNDDESAFYSVLQEAKSYANLSLIAYVFQNKYGQSLAEWYAYYLSELEEQQKIKIILDEYV